MRKYRIAYFTADTNYELVESTLQGLNQYVEDHPQISLCIFDCFGMSRNASRNMAGYAIFKLADLERFDGLLIQGNQIIPPIVREHISRAVLQNHIPAVSVDCPIKGCHMIGLDNRQAQMDITEHIIRDHHARKLVYLTGELNNDSPNGPLRVEGFQAACDKYGIEKHEIEIIPCSWQTGDGFRVGKKWLSENRKLPDAFICANDEMAIGLIEALTLSNVRIPEDVKVTGFDGITSAELSDPCLSTIYRDFGSVNYHAMEMLIGLINHKEVNDECTFTYQLVPSESCGCPHPYDLSRIKNRHFRRVRFMQNFNSLQDQLSEDLVRASDLPELMQVFQRHSNIFGSDQVFLCINDFYFDQYGREESADSSSPFGREIVMLKDRGKENSSDPPSFIRFETHRLLPESILAKNRFMVFYPLQSDSGTIGYLALNRISEVTRLNLHQSLLSFLAISIENVQKKQLLHQMKDRFEQLYVRDELTGLYNRFGLERYGEQLFRRLLRDEKGVLLLFVDVDGLKRINDQYGHDNGDLAILSAARILTASIGEDSFLMRYGGDEFLIIVPLNQEEAVQRIRNKADSCNSLPFRLSLSIGCQRITEAGNKNLDDWIHEADQKMYIEKRKRKQENQTGRP